MLIEINNLSYVEIIVMAIFIFPRLFNAPSNNTAIRLAEGQLVPR